MNLPLSSQLFGFAVSVAGGFVLGAVYDLFRIWRVFFRSGHRAVFFQDVFYLFFTALFTFLLALGVSGGEVRFYLVLGETAGFFLYLFSVGLVTVRLSRLIVNFFERFLFTPLKKLFYGLWKYAKKIASAFTNLMKKVFSNRKNSLKRRGKVVYNQRKAKRGFRLRKKGVFLHEGHSK